MSYVSWQDQTFAQGGEGGALEWLLQQIRPEGVSGSARDRKAIAQLARVY